MIKLNNLNIIYINVNSLISHEKRLYLTEFLEQRKLDIVLLGETKLSKKHILYFEKYNMIRQDRKNSQGAGGTAILIRKDLEFEVIESYNIQNNKKLETTIIACKLNSNKKLFIISAYATVSQGNSFIVDFNNLFKTLELNKEENYYVIAGDLNAKHMDWGNKDLNARGRQLREWLQNNEIEFKCKMYAPQEPTYPRSGSILDIAFIDLRLIVQQDPLNTNIETINYDSDHKAINFTIEMGDDEFNIGKREEQYKLNYTKINWKKFHKKINNLCNQGENSIPDNRNITDDEIEIYLTQMNDIIKDGIKTSVPNYQQQNPSAKFKTPIVKKLIKTKSNYIIELNRLRRENMQNRHNSQIQTTKAIIKNIAKLIKDNIRNEINKYWSKKLKAINTSDRNMFTKVNAIFRKRGKIEIADLEFEENEHTTLRTAGIETETTEKDINNKFIITNHKQKLNLLGNFFEKSHNIDTIENTDDHDIRVSLKFEEIREEIKLMKEHNIKIITFDEQNKSNSEHIDLNIFTNKEELGEIFRKLNNKKSAGIDEIPNMILKHIPEKLINAYCILINNMINNNYFPQQWKTSKIIPIKKMNREPCKLSSYRPINLLPNISKVFEKIIQLKLNKIIEEKQIFRNNQFGFRKRHSTIHAINTITSNICWQLNKKNCVGVCLLDLTTAFDKLWTKGLIYKMEQFEFPMHLIHLIFEMISEKKFIISNGDIQTEQYFSVKNGLQQGTILAPTLFNIFISDLFDEGMIRNCAGLSFADDIAIYASDTKVEDIQRSLQNQLIKTQQYLSKWKLLLNEQKCETILFRRELELCNSEVKKNWRTMQISTENGTAIPHKRMVRYLGIQLNDRLNYSKHINNQIIKAKQAFIISKGIFYNQNINKKVKLAAYKTLIRPILTYGSQIWYNISPSIMENMRKVERRFLRACTSKYMDARFNYKRKLSNKYIYTEANIERIDNFIIKLVRSHFNKIHEIDNEQIAHIYYPNKLYFEKTLAAIIPPEAFIYLDKKGLIQNEEGIPIIYHLYRRATDGRITYNSNIESQINWRYDKTITKKDKELRDKEKKYIWWLKT